MFAVYFAKRLCFGLFLAGFCSMVALPRQAVASLAELSYERYTTSSFWNSTGHRRPAFGQFTLHSAKLSFCYCLPQGHHHLFSQATWSAIHETLNGKKKGWEELIGGWQGLIYQRPRYNFSAQALLIIPGGKYVPALRYGRWGAQGSLLCHHNIFSQTVSGWALLGYRYYVGFPSDQLRARYTLTFSPCSKMQWGGYALTEYGLGDSRRQLPASFIRYHPNYRLVKAGTFYLYRPISQLAVAINCYSHVWGENVGRGWGLAGRVLLWF